MITAAMAAMLMTTATAYGKVENVMAAASRKKHQKQPTIKKIKKKQPK